MKRLFGSIAILSVLCLGALSLGPSALAQTPSGTTALPAPAGLSAAPSPGMNIALSWTAPADPSYPSSQLTYTIYRGGTQIATTTPGTTTYTDTGLDPGANYSYAVSASDPAGNVSPQSDAVAVSNGTTTTTPPPPTVPPVTPPPTSPPTVPPVVPPPPAPPVPPPASGAIHGWITLPISEFLKLTSPGPTGPMPGLPPATNAPEFNGGGNGSPNIGQGASLPPSGIPNVNAPEYNSGNNFPPINPLGSGPSTSQQAISPEAGGPGSLGGPAGAVPMPMGAGMGCACGGMPGAAAPSMSYMMSPQYGGMGAGLPYTFGTMQLGAPSLMSTYAMSPYLSQAPFQAIPQTMSGIYGGLPMTNSLMFNSGLGSLGAGQTMGGYYNGGGLTGSYMAPYTMGTNCSY